LELKRRFYSLLSPLSVDCIQTCLPDPATHLPACIRPGRWPACVPRIKARGVAPGHNVTGTLCGRRRAIISKATYRGLGMTLITQLPLAFMFNLVEQQSRHAKQFAGRTTHPGLWVTVCADHKPLCVQCSTMSGSTNHTHPKITVHRVDRTRSGVLYNRKFRGQADGTHERWWMGQRHMFAMATLATMITMM
jgi:hypothetical protein